MSIQCVEGEEQVTEAESLWGIKIKMNDEWMSDEQKTWQSQSWKCSVLGHLYLQINYLHSSVWLSLHRESRPFQDDFPTFQASGSLYTIGHIELHLPVGFQLPLPATRVQASEPAQTLRFFVPAVVVFWLLLISGLLLQLPSALAFLSTFSLTPCNKIPLLQTFNGGFCFWIRLWYKNILGPYKAKKKVF